MFILEFRSITQPSFVFNLLEQENERNSDPILALSLVNLTGAPVLIAGRCQRER
jgi:hypothetical protein